ncbi:MAG TPA: methylmalonyl Co-A mutase-associated GTPase MeaB, partial [Acidimicrobiales bacterium]|nr:methylmalonyl Co-A mutase-associated GTPase MeaB [Acidimicrobiales bacterium]
MSQAAESAPGRGDPETLLEHSAAGDRGALARLLSFVEGGGGRSRAVARLSYRAAPPYVVGVTGAPGSGKSTLVDRLVEVARRGWPAIAASGTVPEATAEEIDQLAVLAIDPTSPFSGGAILGDRARMQRHATDPSVFIRSMATRGHLGGLSLAVPDALRVVGASGIPVAILETVGVGQVEVEVAAASDTTVVVVTPGWGDSLQAAKAGLLEVADLFVINKADRPGGAQAAQDLRQMLALGGVKDWMPPILDTVATEGEGVEELWAAVAGHRAYLETSGLLASRRAERAEQELKRVLAALLKERLEQTAATEEYRGAVEDLRAGRVDPYEVADRLLGS